MRYYYCISPDFNGCQSFSDSLFTEDCGSVLESSLTQDSIYYSLDINCVGGTEPYSYQWFIDSIAVENLDKISLDFHTHGTYYVLIEDVNLLLTLLAIRDWK